MVKIPVRAKKWILGTAVCIFFFLSGMMISKMQITRNLSASNEDDTLLTFTVPQILLPSDWSSKEKLPGNSFASAIHLSPGIETQGTLNNNNAIDYYAFTIKNPSQIIVDVTNVPKSLYWVLYDSKYQEIASTYRKGTSKGTTQVGLQNPGDYFLKVWADYSEVANYPYTIRLNILPYFE